MVYVRTRKFCCCLPVRFGVVMLSVIGALGGGFVAAVSWLQIVQLRQHPLDMQNEIALWLHTFVFTLIAFISLLGFIGAIIKKRQLMTAYWIILTGLLITSMASGAYTLYMIFSQKSIETVLRCMNGATDSLTMQVCNNGLAIMKGVAVAIYVVTWLLAIYAIIIIIWYSQQLKEEEAAAARHVSAKEISNPAPLTMYNSYGAGGQNTGYAFSTVSNSFGASGTNGSGVPVPPFKWNNGVV